jgi:hypothetical protein
MVIKHPIIASFALFGAGAILVGYLGPHLRALTAPVAALPPIAVSAGAAAAPLAVELAGNALVLPEVRIVGATGVRHVRNLDEQPGDQR